MNEESMNRTMSGSVRADGPIRGQTVDKSEDAPGPQQTKSRPGPEFLGLSRCAGCYNQKVPRPGGDGDSSSSAEDSGPELESESESESTSSSSSSSSSRPVVAETPQIPAPAPAPSPPPGGRSSPAQADKVEEDKNEKKRTMIRRAPLIKSFSLPPSLTPHLTPLSLLPRPPQIISTLHLEVLPGKHSHEASFTIRRHLPEREKEMKPSAGGGGRGASQSQWMGLPWQQGSQQPSASQQHQHLQHHNQYQQQQQQPPPYPLTPPQAPHAPHTHTHTHLYTHLYTQPCWHCYRVHLPYAYWNQCSQRNNQSRI